MRSLGERWGGGEGEGGGRGGGVGDDFKQHSKVIIIRFNISIAAYSVSSSESGENFGKATENYSQWNE